MLETETILTSETNSNRKIIIGTDQSLRGVRIVYLELEHERLSRDRAKKDTEKVRTLN